MGIYLPSMQSNSVGPLAIIMDTSGSVSMKERESYLAEINAIKAELKPEKVYVLMIDTEVAECFEFGVYDDISSLDMTGGGGTDMAPGFKYIEECLPDTETILCFSDLEFFGHWPEESTTPTIWLSTSAVDEAPWGIVVQTNPDL